MNFLSKFTKDGDPDETPTPPQSPPPPASRSVLTSGSPAKPKEESGSVSVRVKPYTGLEIKTLWNHFNKDALMTSTEMAELVERILVKDATDILSDVKGTKAWREYCSQALKVMDTSHGGTVDLGEFTSDFNSFYQSRFYYVIKHLFPALNKELKRICRESDLDPNRIAEIESMLVGDGSSSSISDSQVRKYKETIESLTKRLEDSVREAASTADEVRKLSEALNRSNAENQELRSQQQSEQATRKQSQGQLDTIARLEQVVESLHQELEVQRRDKIQAEALYNERISSLMRENSALKAEMLEKEDEANRWRDRADQNEKEASRLKANRSDEIQDWRSKFNAIIAENEKCRNVMSDMRNEIIRVNTALLEVQLKGKEEKMPKNASFHATSLSGVALDPLRIELVNQFGSLEAVIGKRKRVTLHELESIAAALGYSREYCKKLFFALDVKNKGVLSMEQFSRPLPMLNSELCLLTQDRTP